MTIEGRRMSEDEGWTRSDRARACNVCLTAAEDTGEMYAREVCAVRERVQHGHSTGSVGLQLQSLRCRCTPAVRQAEAGARTC